MIEEFNSICEFRRNNPGGSGSGINVNDPRLIPVKSSLAQLKNELETKFNHYRGFDFNVEVSAGQGYFPSVLHAAILPQSQSVSSGIYAVICFDIKGRGALVGCAESITHPQGLNTIIRKRKNSNLLIDVDGDRLTTKYNNTYENPKEFYPDLRSDKELLYHLEVSLDLALYHLGILDSPQLNINNRVQAELNNPDFNPNDLKDGREKIARQIVARRGQKKFRNAVLKAYNYECAVTKNNVESVLEAAHIMPYSGERTNHIQNGILLRSDIHVLFDLGLLTIEADSKTVKIHSSLNDSYYYQYHGSRILVPQNLFEHPSIEALRWHNEFEFLS